MNEHGIPSPHDLDAVRSEATLSTHNVLAAFEVARTSPTFRRLLLDAEKNQKNSPVDCVPMTAPAVDAMRPPNASVLEAHAITEVMIANGCRAWGQWNARRSHSPGGAPVQVSSCGDPWHREVVGVILRGVFPDAVWATSDTKDAIGQADLTDADLLDWLDKQRQDMVERDSNGDPELVGHDWYVRGQCSDIRTAIRREIEYQAKAKPAPETSDGLPF